MTERSERENIEILPLAERRDAIPVLAAWHHREWASFNPGETLPQRVARLMAHVANEDLPLTWVARRQDLLLGSASLVPCDMETRSELGPWLASVLVDPAQRSQGVGSLLVKHVAREARLRGFSRLHLFTADRTGFYERLGWRLMENIEYRGTYVSLMAIDLEG